MLVDLGISIKNGKKALKYTPYPAYILYRSTRDLQPPLSRQLEIGPHLPRLDAPFHSSAQKSTRRRHTPRRPRAWRIEVSEVGSRSAIDIDGTRTSYSGIEVSTRQETPMARARQAPLQATTAFAGFREVEGVQYI